MSVLELRAGSLLTPEFYRSQNIDWPEKVHSSAYIKPIVSELTVNEIGIVGNEIGAPTHLKYKEFRAVMVFNELIFPQLEKKIPECVGRLHRGKFGENITVSHPDLMPSVVCVGDKFRIGTAQLEVTGPRHPCPKVDAMCGVSGVTRLASQHGWAGYFMRVIRPGIIHVGDTLELLERPYPGYSIQRISEGLWGPPEQQNNSVAFLSALASMDMLIPRHYRDLAASRLAALQEHHDEGTDELMLRTSRCLVVPLLFFVVSKLIRNY